MNILQTLKDFFSRYFPLHLNETVQDLEDENEDFLDAVEYYDDLLHAAGRHIQDLQETNRELLRDNRYLDGNLLEARRFIREKQKELEDIYSSMTPKLSSWPMPVSAALEDTRFGLSFIRVELPALRLSASVNQAIRQGLYEGYIESFADSIAHTANREVRSAVIDTLKNILPIKKESNV